MVKNYDPQTVHDFIVGDFRDAWDALAAVPDPAHRANFMFGRQAMALLEWASRLCMSEPSGMAIRDFARELQRIEPRYFTVLPGTCDFPKDFALPSIGHLGSELLQLMFDLIRHGQGHQYQQIVAELSDGCRLAIQLYGARHHRTLASVQAAGRPTEHLAWRRDSDGDLELHVRPEVLFADIDAAIKAADLLARGLTFKYLERPRPSRAGSMPPHYTFASTALESALQVAGHSPVPPSAAQAAAVPRTGFRGWLRISWRRVIGRE